MNIVLAENEKWISGYEGMYSVDTTGVIYSHHRKKRPMTGGVIYDKSRESLTYRILTLSSGGKQKTVYVHRMVAEAFLENPQNKKEVNHIDGNKLNNSVDNLEWSTRSENTLHAYDNGLMSSHVVTSEEWKTRVDKFIMDANTGGLVQSYISKMIDRDALHRNHIPMEIDSVSKNKRTEYSPLFLWNHYIDLFRLCDSELSLSQVAKIVGMDQSMISYLRSGKRGKRARKVYDKYKDDPYYFVNYKPVYKYYI